MKVYIVQDKSAVFKENETSSLVENFEGNIIPADPKCDFEKRVCERLENWILPHSATNILTHVCSFRTLSLSLKFKRDDKDYDPYREKYFYRSYTSEVEVKGELLKVLKKNCGDDVRVRVTGCLKLNYVDPPYPPFMQCFPIAGGSGVKIFTQDMSITTPAKNKLGFAKSYVPISPQEKDLVCEALQDGDLKNNLVGEISIELIIRNSAPFADAWLIKEFGGRALETAKRLLMNEAVHDVVIIPSNGNPIPAVKCFLTAHSPVFAAMFNGEMKEATSKQVKIDDMTESGVKAMLAYLYYGETKDANEDCTIALALLQAANKYQMASLEALVTDLLCAKPIDWFSMDVAIELLLFARRIKDGGRLKRKAAQAINMLDSDSEDDGADDDDDDDDDDSDE